jgi:hypothetical protein
MITDVEHRAGDPGEKAVKFWKDLLCCNLLGLMKLCITNAAIAGDSIKFVSAK